MHEKKNINNLPINFSPMHQSITDIEKKLIIELDGGQHADQEDYDAQRTAFLESEGYRVIRFWNHEVMENRDAVLTNILETLESATSLTLPPAGRGDVIVPSTACGGGLGRGKPHPNNTQEILDGLQLTGYFLSFWLLTPHNRKLPAARGRLIQHLSKAKALHGAEA